LRNSHDKANLFRRPVTKAEAPDYFDIVKQPMCWEMIDAKLDRHEYWDLQVFKVTNAHI
jgi:NuA3 HAT complex component NTO1